MDKILEKFFELERWEYAIDKGLGKGISKAQLYQLTKPETRVAMYEAIRDGLRTSIILIWVSDR